MTAFARTTARFAFLSALLNILGAVTLIVFFALGGLWGPLNDVFSVLGALAMLPLAWALHHRHAARYAVLSAAASLVGAASMLTLAALQSLLVAGVFGFEATLGPVLTASALIGVWLLAHNGLGWAGGSLPRGLAALGLAAGAGYVLSGLGFALGGQAQPLFAAGFLTAMLAYPLWALGLGRLASRHAQTGLQGA
jgi:hypothetical protein